MALKGHLQHFGLGELFQTLACNRHTGTLYVSSRAEKKTIYFSTGSIAFLASGDGTVRLGEILRRQGRVTDAQIEAASLEQENSDKQIGRILLEQGVIGQEDLQEALRTKIEEELFELLLWEEGDFEFVPDFCPPDLLEPMQRYTQVRVDPQTVIIEGLRQLDESRIIRSCIPDARIWLRRVVEEIPADADLSPVERNVWEHCAEPAPVDRIQGRAPNTRFVTLKTLYRFVEEGWLRTLTFDEHLEIARRLRRHNEQDAAIDLYRFLRDWGIDESDAPEFLDETGRYLVEMGRKKEGASTLRRALERLRQVGNNASAWEIGRLLRDLSPHDLELLQLLWPLRNAASPRAMEELRRELLSALKKAGRFHDAEALLAEIEDLEHDNSEYWIDRGEIARKLGSRERAIEFLQQGERAAQRRKDLPEVIRIARILFSIDPDMPGLRARIQDLLTKEAGAQRARKIRRIAVFAAVAVVLVVAIPSIRYETRARDLYRSAVELRTPRAEAQDLQRAQRHLSKIVEDYGLSTVASRSREELETLDLRIERLRQEERARIDAIEDRDRSARLRRRTEAKELLASSESALDRRDYAAAREAIETLLSGPVRSLPADEQQEIRIPLAIETNPAGATVSVDGNVLGESPVIHRFVPGTRTFTITVEREGCEPLELTHTDAGEPVLELLLPRAPLASGALLGGLDRPAVQIPDRIIVPCRDGRVYVLPEGDRVVELADRVIAGGVAGHPSAQVMRSGNDLVIAAFSGDVHCIDHRTWEIRWTITHDAPVISATAVPPGAIALGDEDGRIVLLDLGTGSELARLETPYPIDELAFRGDSLIAVDRVRHARTLEVPSLGSILEQRLPAPVAAILWDGSFLLSSGTRIGFGSRTQWPAPRTAVVERDGRSVYGGDRCWVEVVDGKAKAHPAPTVVSCPPLPIGDITYLGGTDGHVHCVDRAGNVLWSVATESIPVDLLQTSEGTVLALLRNGQLLLLEGSPQ